MVKKSEPTLQSKITHRENKKYGLIKIKENQYPKSQHNH